MKVHFIAIGGSAMHNLALALKSKGFEVSGSDDEIFEPSKSKLAKAGLLPQKQGWYQDRITDDLDAVILGMHARIDNPELLKAQELNLKIYSYPEYIYEQTKDKTRVVIGGSHGKTTTTSIIMHVLKSLKIDFDYMVGAQLDGFDTMVKLSKEAKIAIFEGDEYLSSPIDRRPKFHLYHPHIALLTGIAWDHINVFPSFENYLLQFSKFVELIKKDGSLIYFEEDKHIKDIISTRRSDIEYIAYKTPEYTVVNNITNIKTSTKEVELNIFGEHNLQNIAGAYKICCKLGVSEDDFYASLSNFKGASKRLQTLASNETSNIYLDFAHSPSKLEATTKAVKSQFKDRKLIACMELHTFSSLQENFLPHYKDTMKYADKAYVYFNPETLKHKKLKEITKQQVKDAFASDNVEVFTNSDELMKILYAENWNNKNLLLMSSGNFSGKDLSLLAKNIIEK